MDYKEKVIALLNSQELSKEQKEKLESIFPELKESEDERISKALLEMVHDTTGDELWVDYNVHKEEALAWLEKQCEQKPIDKVKSKFKAGDWISGYYTSYKVLSVNNDGYVVEDVDGNKINILFENEKFHHLWTIQDAKDGDVLAESKGDVILMFRGIGNTEWDDVIDYHCYYVCYRKDFIVQENVKHWGDTENSQLKPATKEQRDLLFQKMKEEGYEWDADKKELKKIEQKQEWSEEDKRKIDRIYSILRQAADTHAFSTSCRLIGDKECIELQDFLKSLRPQSQWKPSEEQMRVLNLAIRCGINRGTTEETILVSLFNDLKKLREE